MNGSGLITNASVCWPVCISNTTGNWSTSNSTLEGNKTVPVATFYCQKYADSSVYPLLIVCFLAVLENAFTCYIIYRNKILRTATNVFVFSLCIADMLCAGVLLPVDVFCQGTLFYAYLAAIIVFSYAANLMAVTYERLISITKPLRYQSIVTKSVAFKIALAAWIIPIGYCLLPLIWGSKQTGIEHKIFIIIALLLFLVTPFFFICFVYARILIEVHRLLKNNYHRTSYQFDKKPKKRRSLSSRFKSSFGVFSSSRKTDSDSPTADQVSQGSKRDKRLKLREERLDQTLSVELFSPDDEFTCSCLPSQDAGRFVACGNRSEETPIHDLNDREENASHELNSESDEHKRLAIQSFNDVIKPLDEKTKSSDETELVPLRQSVDVTAPDMNCNSSDKLLNNKNDVGDCEADLLSTVNKEENVMENKEQLKEEKNLTFSTCKESYLSKECNNGKISNECEDEHIQICNEAAMKKDDNLARRKWRKFKYFSSRRYSKADNGKKSTSSFQRKKNRSMRLRDMFDEIRASMAFAAVAFTYMFTWIPVIYMTFMIAVGKQDEAPMKTMTRVNIWSIALNAAIDPLFYALIMRNFRKVIKRQFRNLRSRCS